MQSKRFWGEGNFKIAVYKVYRNYGGPEEGGWWYNSGDLVTQSRRRFSDEMEAIKYANKLRHRVDRLWNMPRGSESDIYSVSGRYQFQVMVARRHEDFFPQERPYYS